MHKKQKDTSILERFQCAGALLVRGLSAPITRPFIYLSKMPQAYQEGDWVRQSRDFRAKMRVSSDMITLIYGLGKGFLAGSIICAESLFEAPYQLIRPDGPQSRPWLERKYNW